LTRDAILTKRPAGWCSSQAGRFVFGLATGTSGSNPPSNAHIGSIALGPGTALSTTLWHTLFLGTPRAEVIGLIGVLAFAPNLASVLILIKYKDSDANVHSV
jgi:hypothetical protein